MDSIIKCNYDLFKGVGQFPELCALVVDKNIAPVIMQPKKVPRYRRESVGLEMKLLEKINYIERVKKPKGWISNLVLHQDFPYFLNCSELNKAIVQEKPQSPTLQELKDKLSGKSFYSVLNLNNINWQIVLDDSSSDLCTFHSPCGYYKFRRLPLGICSTTQICCEYIYDYFHDLPGVFVVNEDLIIYGNHRKEHDDRLKGVFSRAREIQIRFRKDSFLYCMKNVRYAGFVFSKHGCCPDTSQIQPILKLKSPENRAEFKGIFNLLNYISIATPEIGQELIKFKELLCEHKFVWRSDHEETLTIIKKTISNQINEYNENEAVTIQCHASETGCGCCLMQDGVPLGYAATGFPGSRSLYSKLEKEFFSLILAVFKFHDFIYNKHATIHTDHRCLMKIFHKNFDDVNSVRLRTMKIACSRYDLTLQYVPTVYLPVVNALSKIVLDFIPLFHDNSFYEITHDLGLNDYKKRYLVEEAKKDPVLHDIQNFIKNGWPDRVLDVDDNLKFFFHLRDDIYLEDNLVFYNGKVIVPMSMAEIVDVWIREWLIDRNLVFIIKRKKRDRFEQIRKLIHILKK